MGPRALKKRLYFPLPISNTNTHSIGNLLKIGIRFYASWWCLLSWALHLTHGGCSYTSVKSNSRRSSDQDSHRSWVGSRYRQCNINLMGYCQNIALMLWHKDSLEKWLSPRSHPFFVERGKPGVLTSVPLFPGEVNHIHFSDSDLDSDR